MNLIRNSGWTEPPPGTRNSNLAEAEKTKNPVQHLRAALHRTAQMQHLSLSFWKHYYVTLDGLRRHHIVSTYDSRYSSGFKHSPKCYRKVCAHTVGQFGEAALRLVCVCVCVCTVSTSPPISRLALEIWKCCYQ